MLGSQRGLVTSIHAFILIFFTMESHEKNDPSGRQWLLFTPGLESLSNIASVSRFFFLLRVFLSCSHYCLLVSDYLSGFGFTLLLWVGRWWAGIILAQRDKTLGGRKLADTGMTVQCDDAYLGLPSSWYVNESHKSRT